MIYSVAIDGPSASGKSTIAKLLSKKLSITYIDTGAMYRAVAYYFIENSVNDFSDTNIEKVMKGFKLKYDNQKVFVNDILIKDDFLRTSEVTNLVSKVSASKYVRKYLVDFQRKLSVCESVVMDGRDIGTNVLPNATYKFYMIASAEERAKRRLADFENKGDKKSYEDVLAEIKDRDFKDANRELNPLVKANDAIEIDTSHLKIDDVLKFIIERIEI